MSIWGAVLALIVAGSAAADVPPERSGAAPLGLSKAAPSALLDAAIVAHGGTRALKRLAGLVGQVREAREGGDERVFTRTLAMSGALAERWTQKPLRTGRGVLDDSCWFKPHEVVLDCEPERAVGWAAEAQAWAGLGLLSLKNQTLAAAPRYRVAGERCEAFTAGAVTFVFSPSSGRLVQTRYRGFTTRPGRFVDRFDGYHSVRGALVPARITRTFDGQAYSVEDWGAFRPGRVGRKALRAPSQVRDGLAGRRSIAARLALRVGFKGPLGGWADALTRAKVTAVSKGLRFDPAGGAILRRLSPPAALEAEWQLDLSLRPNAKAKPEVFGEATLVHLDRVAAWGTFLVGTAGSAFDRLDEADQRMREAGLGPVEGAHWSLILFHDPEFSPAAHHVAFAFLPVLGSAEPDMPASEAPDSDAAREEKTP